ncbi:hypothetical protein [Streptomyces sp. NPDC001205]
MPARPSKSSLVPTEAQMRIVAKLAEGMGTARTAKKLGLAEGSVSSAMTSANRRVGVRFRHALVHACYVLELLPRPDTRPAPVPADDTEAKILWRLALNDSYSEITRNCKLSSLDAMKQTIQALRGRWGAEDDCHLITLGWQHGVLNASRGTGGHQLI